MQLLAPTTSSVAAGSAGSFIVGNAPVTLSATGLAGSEEVDIYYRADSTAAWGIAYEFSSTGTGTALKLTATSPQVDLVGSGEYRCAKDATSAASGLYLSSSKNILAVQA